MKLLISSYANAYDIWHITDFFMRKYKLNLDIYLGANGQDMSSLVPKNWRYINKGEDESFSKSLISYLEDINDEYFILMLDDFMILEDIDMSKLKLAFDFIEKNKGVYLRLTPNPVGDYKIDSNFSRIDVLGKIPYITSLQIAIWKKDFLINLLKYNFSPWEFETDAGKTKEAVSNSNSFFVVNYPFIKYTHFVEKGKFYPILREKLKDNNLQLISKREFLSKGELQKIKGSKIKETLRKLLSKRLYVLSRKILNKKEL